MGTEAAVVTTADVLPAERKGCRLGFLSWFWSAGAWASLFLALLGWVACVGMTLGFPNGIVRWFTWCSTVVQDVGTFILLGFLSIIVMLTYIGLITLGFGIAMVSHGVGLVTGTGTVLMPGASPWARLSGVFPLGAHVGGALIGLYLLLFSGPNDPNNTASTTGSPTEQSDTDVQPDAPSGDPSAPVELKPGEPEPSPNK